MVEWRTLRSAEGASISIPRSWNVIDRSAFKGSVVAFAAAPDGPIDATTGHQIMALVIGPLRGPFANAEAFADFFVREFAPGLEVERGVFEPPWAPAGVYLHFSRDGGAHYEHARLFERDGVGVALVIVAQAERWNEELEAGTIAGIVGRFQAFSAPAAGGPAPRP